MIVQRSVPQRMHISPCGLSFINVHARQTQFPSSVVSCVVEVEAEVEDMVSVAGVEVVLKVDRSCVDGSKLTTFFRASKEEEWVSREIS